jgi:ABC-type bacteriocin/lantibiotic exporter with double-glycine peptidase domain
LFLVIIVFLIIKFTIKKGLQTSLEESKYKYSVVSWLEELARSKDSFKLVGNTSLPQVKTDERVTGYLESRENHFNVLKTQFKLLIFFKVIVALGLLIVGGLLVLDQQMNIGQFIAAEIIILLVIDSAEKLIMTLSNVFDILTSVEKLGQITDLELDSQTSQSSIKNQIDSPINVEIKNISFTYPGRTKTVLKNISYNFHSNGSYCISGKNGSGKSTLIHLISGLYQPQKGSICMNNLPVGNYAINDLYKVLGNGLSEESIFEGSFIENITLGRDFITIEDVQWAVDKAILSEYVKSLPKGLDTAIESSGQTLSKSIIQRIIIARSIVNRPKLVLLENNIDFLEEVDKMKIIDFLTSKENGWTLISVSNDNYLKQKCDAVLNMIDGEISY